MNVQILVIQKFLGVTSTSFSSLINSITFSMVLGFKRVSVMILTFSDAQVWLFDVASMERMLSDIIEIKVDLRRFKYLSRYFRNEV